MDLRALTRSHEVLVVRLALAVTLERHREILVVRQGTWSTFDA
jgi:hypothetical protein